MKTREEIQTEVRQQMERSNLVYRCIAGELTETQFNWWLNKLNLNRDEILKEIEQTKNALRKAKFVFRLVLLGLLFLLVQWLW